jgi:hypothetical protein
VPPLAFHVHQLAFDEPSKMAARRLRADVCSQRKLPGRQRTPTHQLQQHRRSGGLTQKIGRTGELMMHTHSIASPLFEYFGVRRNIRYSG